MNPVLKSRFILILFIIIKFIFINIFLVRDIRSLYLCDQKTNSLSNLSRHGTMIAMLICFLFSSFIIYVMCNINICHVYQMQKGGQSGGGAFLMIVVIRNQDMPGWKMACRTRILSKQQPEGHPLPAQQMVILWICSFYHMIIIFIALYRNGQLVATLALFLCPR